jgi:hypothetical protein
MENQGLSGEVAQFVRFYQEEILSLQTRTVTLLGRKCRPKLMYTFLGYELKLGRKRLTCPDMVTVRYLKIFAQLGCKSIEIPYDPTHTARVLPFLERLFDAIDRKLIVGAEDGRLSAQRRTQRTYRKIRTALSKTRSLVSATES